MSVYGTLRFVKSLVALLERVPPGTEVTPDLLLIRDNQYSNFLFSDMGVLHP